MRSSQCCRFHTQHPVSLLHRSAKVREIIQMHQAHTNLSDRTPAIAHSAAPIRFAFTTRHKLSTRCATPKSSLLPIRRSASRSLSPVAAEQTCRARLTHSQQRLGAPSTWIMFLRLSRKRNEIPFQHFRPQPKICRAHLFRAPVWPPSTNTLTMLCALVRKQPYLPVRVACILAACS